MARRPHASLPVTGTKAWRLKCGGCYPGLGVRDQQENSNLCFWRDPWCGQPRASLGTLCRRRVGSSIQRRRTKTKTKTGRGREETHELCAPAATPRAPMASLHPSKVLASRAHGGNGDSMHDLPKATRRVSGRSFDSSPAHQPSPVHQHRLAHNPRPHPPAPPRPPAPAPSCPAAAHRQWGPSCVPPSGRPAQSHPGITGLGRVRCDTRSPCWLANSIMSINTACTTHTHAAFCAGHQHFHAFIFSTFFLAESHFQWLAQCCPSHGAICPAAEAVQARGGATPCRGRGSGTWLWLPQAH